MMGESQGQFNLGGGRGGMSEKSPEEWHLKLDQMKLSED